MKKLIGAAVCAALMVSACATHPNNIDAAYVSPMQYANYNCDQLRGEHERLSVRLEQVTGQQRKAANQDAWAFGVGMVLFWPALFFMANGDKKEELGRLKGEFDAIQSTAVQKQCVTAPPAPTQTAAVS